MTRLAIYDLDRTLVPKATFTPFLLFAARRMAPWRLALLPLWVGLMLAYKLGFLTRTQLKRIGMRVMIGPIADQRLRALGAEFASGRIARDGWSRGVMVLVEEDRALGARVVIATAAFDFYAESFGELLGVDGVIATRWREGEIVGGNCYGARKRERVVEWMAASHLAREAVFLRFVSDSLADAPLLDFADEPIFVTHSKRKAHEARRRGWKTLSPDRPQAAQ